MDIILKKFSDFRYEECIELLVLELKKEDTLVENFIKQNCLIVCQCLAAIANDETARIDVLQAELYKLYQNMIALSMPNVIIPIQLELTALLNFIWWTIHYVELNHMYKEDKTKFLPIVHRGLKRVLGISCISSIKMGDTGEILNDIQRTGENLEIGDNNTLILLSEVIVLILLYLLIVDNSITVVEQCLYTVNKVINNMQNVVLGLEAVKEYQIELPINERLVKFGFIKINSTVSNINSSPLDYLQIIKLTCLFLLKKHKEILACMKTNLNHTMKPLWCYLGALSSNILEDCNMAQGFVSMTSGLDIFGVLKSKFVILQGLLLSKGGNHKDALKCFGEAKSICPNNVVTVYYMGEEYGKIGLYDEMTECLDAIIKMKAEQRVHNPKEYASGFVGMVLNILHPADEITETEALYASAVAYGLTDKFREAADIFERYFNIFPVEEKYTSSQGRIIKTPNFVTVLHEAATMNVLTGNFSRSQFLISNASIQYTAMKMATNQAKDDGTYVCNVLRMEVGSSSTAREETEEGSGFFTEDMVYHFEEDVISLMLKAEIERIQEQEDYKVTLGTIATYLSKYFAQMQNQNNMKGEDTNRLSLVKALSAKVFLKIAEYQMKNKTSVEIERTFKRALGCNQGDKDVLLRYYKFLLSMGKDEDARKLWKTFRSKKNNVTPDQCQSLTLMYLLKNDVTRRDLQKIEIEVEYAGNNI